ncbi:MAG: hypothetical protein PVI86_07855 [Phycisphaerae bacterium]
MRRQPFRPFRLFLTDGSSDEVRHLEMPAVSRVEVVVGMLPVGDGLPERFASLDPLHAA